MLDGTHYFECECGADEHTLRFILDKEDGILYTHIYLNHYLPWWKRAWRAIRYVFGYRCRYGHWDSWLIRAEDAPRLRALLDELEASKG